MAEVLPSYEDFARQQEEDRRLRVGNELDIQADRASRILKVRTQTGMPEEAIDADLDFIEAESSRGEFDPEAYKDTPKWKSFAAENPYNLAVLKDDHESLNRLERSWESITTSWKGSFAQQERMEIGHKQMRSGVATPEDEAKLKDLEKWDVDHDYNAPIEAKLFVWMGKQGANLYGALKGGAEYAQYTAPAGAAIGGTLGAGAGGIGALPGAAAGYGTGMAIGMTTGAAKYAYEHESGGAYLEYRDMGFNHEHARAAAMTVGAVNAAFEAGGSTRILRKLPGVETVSGLLGNRLVKDVWARPSYRAAFNDFAKQTSITMATEVGTEIMQESMTIAGGEILKRQTGEGGEYMTFDEYKSRVADIAVETFKSTLLLAGSGPAANYYGDSRRAHQAKQRELAFRAYGEAAEGSKLRTSVPAKYREFVDSVSEGDSVLIEADRFDEYFQSKGHDPNEMAEQLGIDKQALAEARAEGGDISIPAGEFAEKIAPTGHYAGLSADLRTNADQMSARDADEFYSRRDAFMEDFEKLSEELGDTTDFAARDRVINDITGQLIGARYQPHAAQMSAQFFQGIPNLAERAGISPEEFYDEVFGGISRTTNVALEAKPDINMLVDPLLDRLRRGEVPTQRELRGPSLLEFIRDSGGIREEGGELASRDFSKGAQPGLLNNVSGKTFDGIAEIASEAGYIADFDQDLLLDAIDQEMSGNKVYGADFTEDTDLTALSGQLQDLDELLNMAGIDLDAMSNAEVRAALEAFETFDQLDKSGLESMTELAASLLASKDPEVSAALMGDLMRAMPKLFDNQNFDDITFADTVRHTETGQLVEMMQSAQVLHRRAVKRRNMLSKLWDCVSG